AMAGPTPVSALIHAATMVTAGVYLIARMHVLYDLAPAVRVAIGIIGAVTLLLSAFSALVQRDIKRVLAFSTISQLGYMFLALGVAASSAALFHLMTHAFFKALLFLAAGSVILSLHHEQDLFKMGGLRKELQLAFWTTLIGAASLAGVPLITAGFFSKERILWEVWSSPMGGPWLWTAGVIGVFLTALYSFRLVFLVFFGERKTAPRGHPGVAITVPLLALAALSIGGGWMEGLLLTALPNHTLQGGSVGQELFVQGLAIGATVLGITLAYLLFLRRPDVVEDLSQTQPVKGLRWFALRGWAFNRLYGRLFVRPFLEAASASKQDLFDRGYDRLLVRPFLWVAQVNEDDLIDRLYDGLMRLGRFVHELFRRMQTGEVRWYATVLAAGSVTIIALIIWG
ncbi:MAG: proton-conducting transporter membrane subunit, partial [Nitrospiraceae bacterium]